MLEDDLAVAPLRRGGGQVAGGPLLLGVEQLEDPLGGRDAGLEQVHHRRDRGQRLGELAACTG